MVAMSLFSTFSQMTYSEAMVSFTVRLRLEAQARVLTGMRSAYFCRMRSASALRFSKGCSSLNLLRMVAVSENDVVAVVRAEMRLFAVGRAECGCRRKLESPER